MVQERKEKKRGSDPAAILCTESRQQQPREEFEALIRCSWEYKQDSEPQK